MAHGCLLLSKEIGQEEEYYFLNKIDIIAWYLNWHNTATQCGTNSTHLNNEFRW